MNETVWVLIHRGDDFANAYVGIDNLAAYKAFCDQFLREHLLSVYQEDWLEEGTDDVAECDLEAWRLMKDGEWIQATASFFEGARGDGESFYVNEEEVTS